MIQLIRIMIQNVRGIRNLELTPDCCSYAIQGDNGTGKSGVVDAIEFGLTGTMSRLVGDGTSDISLAKHGPHIDFVDKLEQAFVELDIHLTALDEPATIKRNFSDIKNPVFTPDTPEVREAFAEVAKHPEVALTRRQITKFIYSTGTKRSKDIEKLLQLSRVNSARSAMKSARKKSKDNHEAAKTTFNNTCGALKQHLGIADFDPESILSPINAKRKILKLSELEDVGKTTSFVEGMSEKIGKGFTARPTIEKDIQTCKDSIAPSCFDSLVSEIREQVAKIEQDPGLRSAVKQKQLVTMGMDLLDTDQCPLCDNEWELPKLKQHLEKKKKRLQEAEQVIASLEDSSQKLKQLVSTAVFTANQLIGHAKSLKLADEAVSLSQFVSSLELVTKQLDSTEQTILNVASLGDQLDCPAEVISAIDAIQAKVNSLPNGDLLAEASDFLLVAERRMQSVRDAKEAKLKSQKIQKMAEEAYQAYADAAESVLTALYEEVKDDFVEFYRMVNRDDENGFSANINADEGKMDIGVEFYSRGKYPPNALHSEGHQDTMGLCLYLALMRKLFGDKFRFVLLDDVVMSVDNSHRYQLCHMLKAKFPNTQFFITTHEKIWFQRLQDSKLIEKGNGTVFQNWSVDQGPKVENMQTAWEEIDAEVENNKIETAAFLLRRHIESVMPQIVESLGGALRYRQSQNYCGGELTDAAVSRLKSLLKLAGKSTNNLKSSETVESLTKLINEFTESEQQKRLESWPVNAAIHFNPWADFVREDFVPVVTAFKRLLSCFSCEACGSWLYVVPKPGTPADKEWLRCNCEMICFNLKKPKAKPPRRKKRPKLLDPLQSQQKEMFADSTPSNPKES